MSQPLPTPLYQRVFGVLHQRIRTGVYAAGQRLNTEQELADEFGVSKATIRQAVGELVQRGLVSRQQGRGTFVTEDALADSDPAFVGSLNDLILGTPQLKLRDARVERDVAFPPSVREQLRMTERTGTVVRNRRALGNEVFIYSVHYLAPAIANRVTRKELTATGMTSLLHRKGIALTGAEQSVSAELADPEVAQQLEVAVGAPTLAARRLLNSAGGPVEVMHSWYRGDLYQWRTRLSFDWHGDELRIRPNDPPATAGR